MKIQTNLFGKDPDGRDIYSFNISNDHGIQVRIINYGGIITHLFTPDKYGKSEDIVLGFDKMEDYLQGHPYFGAIVGRYANRIKNAKFKINDKEYTLAVNNGPNHLHGGIIGFDKKTWEAEGFFSENEAGVNMSLVSPDMDEGYPGNLYIEVQYILNNKNELIINYLARTDKTTHLNLTNHSYFNLSGCKTPIYDHILQIDADAITETDEMNIPSGKIMDISGTALDFRKAKEIGRDIESLTIGYDHNYVLNKAESELKLISRLEHAPTGRIMEVLTTEPGMVVYTSNFLDGNLIGKNNVKYIKHFAVCLETNHFPDSPNHPEFPATLLNPGEKYTQTTIYRFPQPK